MLAVIASRLFFFFFNDTATTEIYTLSLHDALPIWIRLSQGLRLIRFQSPRENRGLRSTPCTPPGTSRWGAARRWSSGREALDRKSTRLNSSHANISYAVFCLKKKKTTSTIQLIIYI